MPAIRADPSQVEQVITNLMFNPCDAMPAGGRLTVDIGVSDVTRARAETRAAKPGRYATLTVADTGEGMDADTLRQIFDPFFTTRDPGKGAGLGLAMVHQVVATAATRRATRSSFSLFSLDVFRHGTDLSTGCRLGRPVN